MARPKIHDAALADRLIEEAARLIAVHGTGFNLRALATAAGTSTTAIYSLFGGRAALFAAVHDRAFTSFGATQAAVPITDDPEADILALAVAYRSWALKHPQMYAVIFSTGSGDLPSDHDFAVANDAIQPLRAAVVRLLADRVPDPDEASVGQATYGLWSAVHGFVSLELIGIHPDRSHEGSPEPNRPQNAAYELMARAATAGWLAVLSADTANVASARNRQKRTL